MDREPEIDTDAALASRLVAAQFPQWSELPVTRVEAVSTDNDLYRIGGHLAARLPRRRSAVAAIAKEHEWLPRLAPGLPMDVPLPVARGEAAHGYPFPWSVVRWIEGEPPHAATAGTSIGLARDLGRFVTTLHALDASGGPVAGDHNHWRGAPLTAFDREMRRRFDWMADVRGIGEIAAAWDRGLATKAWAGASVWVHGDLKDANLLARNGALTGVLDWGLAGVGDPASDLSAGWSLFEGAARAAFRAAVAVDEATWARGRAWALVEGVLNVSYYRGRQDDLAEAGRRVIDRVLADEEG
jgi:aminoglycoside phosphotransferase (APT) family kinase protein